MGILGRHAFTNATRQKKKKKTVRGETAQLKRTILALLMLDHRLEGNAAQPYELNIMDLTGYWGRS